MPSGDKTGPDLVRDFEALAGKATQAIGLLQGELRLRHCDDAEDGLWRHACRLEREVQELMGKWL